MNIHQISNEQYAQKFGPVKVTKAFPFKPGSSSAFVLVEDSSDKTAVKIWNPRPDQVPKEGQELTWITSSIDKKSSIAYKEYPVGSGKFAVNISNCSTEQDVGTTPGETSSPSAPVSHAASQGSGSGTTDEKLKSVSKQAALSTHYHIEALLELGYEKDEAIKLSQSSGGIFPLYWFGEKGLP
tara:strand:- start:6205 stop:6753 length:549 start_codon:yes stop_codon:yes gene_type:complete